MADDSSGNLAETEDEKEFQIREQVRLRMEAQLQDELKRIKEKVSPHIQIYVSFTRVMVTGGRIHH